MSPQANRFLGFFGVAAGAILLGFTFFAPSLQGGAGEGWAEVPAKLISAEAVTEEVEEPWGNGTRTRTEHQVMAEIAYDFAGKTYNSGIRVSGFRSEADAASHADSLRAKDPFACYVNPDDPAQARLQPGGSPLTYVYLSGGIIVLAYGLVLLLSNRTLQQHAGVEE